MGNRGYDGQAPAPLITVEHFRKSLQAITTNQSTYFTKIDLLEPLQAISQFLTQHDPLDHSSPFLRVEPALLEFFFHPTFLNQMQKLVRLMVEILERVNEKIFNYVKSSFLKAEEIGFINDLGSFLLFVSSGKITGTIDSMGVRSDVEERCQELLRKLERENGGELENIGNSVETLTDEEKETVEKVLRVTLSNFISVRDQALTPSDSNLQKMVRLENTLFMLYTKVYFSHYTSEFHTPTQKQSFKSNIKIGTYFLSSGSNFFNPSVYEAAVIFLYSLLKLPGIQPPPIKNLPSHYFKNLPVVPSASIYDHLMCYVLFTLKYTNDGGSLQVRFFFNRIFSIKFLQMLVATDRSKSEKGSSLNKTVIYYLEELCLQVKMGHIERACVYELVRMIVEKFESARSSQIFKKFLESSNLKYNLKFADKEIKVNPIEVITELEDDKDTCCKEYKPVSQRFLYDNVLLRPTIVILNDRSLWNQILPGILENKEDQEIQALSQLREEGEQDEMNGSNKSRKDGEEEQKKEEQKEEQKEENQNNQNIENNESSEDENDEIQKKPQAEEIGAKGIADSEIESPKDSNN